MSRLNRILCGLQGHDKLVQFQQATVINGEVIPARIYLRCANCGWESEGMDLETSESLMRQRCIKPSELAQKKLLLQ